MHDFVIDIKVKMTQQISKPYHLDESVFNSKRNHAY